jgi:hypothetical protein
MKLNQIEEQSFALAVLGTYDISGLGIDTSPFNVTEYSCLTF